MKNTIHRVISFLFTVFIFVFVVDWKDPQPLEYVLIAVYVIYLMLMIVYAILHIRELKNE